MSDIVSYSTTNSRPKHNSDTRPDAVDLVAKFQHEVIHNRPNLETMKTEIRMNALKIRPYAGDVFHLNMSNDQFIEALWSIVKLEEYVFQSEKQLSRKQAYIFFQLMRQVKETFQDKINRIDMRLPHVKTQGIENPVTMEIFRELVPLKKKKRVH